MPQIEGIKTVQKALANLRNKKISEGLKQGGIGSVVVGYNASYALWVHESIEMKLRGLPRKGKDGKGRYWDPQGRGQAKYLEQPARQRRGEIASKITEAATKGQSFLRALLVAGLFLQRESQKLVPVDTGNLKGSAFTEIEK